MMDDAHRGDADRSRSMNTIKTEYTQAELDEIDDRIVQALAFIRDVIDDPSLMDQFPKPPPHLVVTSARRHPEATPDLRTPHTDVYIAGKNGSSVPPHVHHTPAG
jgi:hypothetical protein